MTAPSTAAPTRMAGVHARWLACVLCGAAALFFLGGFGLPGTGFYYRHSSYFWDGVDEHQFTVTGADADVLLIGDSSLVFGVIPRRIQELTGLSAYDLGLPIPLFVIASDLALERYLAGNRRPLLAILYLAPTTRAHPPYPYPPYWYEGMSMLRRYGGIAGFARYALREPHEAAKLPFIAWNELFRFDWWGRRSAAIDAALRQGRGYVPPYGPPGLNPAPPVLADGCALAPYPIAPDRALIAGFRRRFAAQHIAFAVYVAPLADCDGSFAAVGAAWHGLADNEPYTLPHADFVADPQRVHLVRAGAETNSRRVAEFIRQTLFGAETSSLAGPASAPK